jgi:hypothetical protein
MNLDDKAQLIGTLDYESVIYKDGEGGIIASAGSNFNDQKKDTAQSTYEFFFEKGNFTEDGTVALVFFNAEPKPIAVDTTYDAFKKTFRPGLYPFLKGFNPIMGKSVAIEFFDNQLTPWVTSIGPQSSSTFSVASVEEGYLHSSKAIKLKAIFSCTLYNMNGLSMPFSGSIQFYLIKPFP